MTSDARRDGVHRGGRLDTAQNRVLVGALQRPLFDLPIEIAGYGPTPAGQCVRGNIDHRDGEPVLSKQMGDPVPIWPAPRTAIRSAISILLSASLPRHQDIRPPVTC